MDSYISPKTKKRLPSNINGLGIFAIENIDKDEIIAIRQGSYLTRNEMSDFNIEFGFGIQINDNLFIAHKNKEELEKNLIGINHSCHPNCGMKGDNEAIAMRDIKNGEELTVDYAMFMDDNSSMECNCGSQKCRKIITGKDWMKLELQEKYKGYFTDYIQSKINEDK